MDLILADDTYTYSGWSVESLREALDLAGHNVIPFDGHSGGSPIRDLAKLKAGFIELVRQKNPGGIALDVQWFEIPDAGIEILNELSIAYPKYGDTRIIVFSKSIADHENKLRRLGIPQRYIVNRYNVLVKQVVALFA